jgi:hypothetical protein
MDVIIVLMLGASIVALGLTGLTAYLALGALGPIAVVALALVVLYPVRWWTSRSNHYAVIVPISLDELRKQERSRNKWQNVSGVVGIVSLLLAISVAIANRWFPVP